MKPVTVITGEWTGKLCTEQKLNEFLENDGARLLYGCIYENAGSWNVENLFQDCLITAARCIEAYDEARMDTKLTTYIWQACENAIKMMYRKRDAVKVHTEENLTVPMSEEVFNVEDHTAPGLDESIGEKVDLETRVAALRKAIEAPATGLTGEETVLDLYCGAGTIGLSMARRAGRLIGVEVEPRALLDLLRAETADIII